MGVDAGQRRLQHRRRVAHEHEREAHPVGQRGRRGEASRIAVRVLERDHLDPHVLPDPVVDHGLDMLEDGPELVRAAVGPDPHRDGGRVVEGLLVAEEDRLLAHHDALGLRGRC